MATGEPLKLTYFALWAKGPAPALALAHSGLKWEGGADYGNDTHPLAKYKSEWLGHDKAQFNFKNLPVLEVPGLGQVGQELAILNYIGRVGGPRMSGANDAEFAASQQLLSLAEDIYQKLRVFSDSLGGECGKTSEEKEAFWNAHNPEAHNKNFTFRTYLTQLEHFHGLCGAGEGRFTASGCSVGECKLWATLHACILIRSDCLGDFPACKAFYAAFLATPATAEIVKNGGKMPRAFVQYFLG